MFKAKGSKRDGMPVRMSRGKASPHRARGEAHLIEIAGCGIVEL